MIDMLGIDLMGLAPLMVVCNASMEEWVSMFVTMVGGLIWGVWQMELLVLMGGLQPLDENNRVLDLPLNFWVHHMKVLFSTRSLVSVSD
jgi:hypothetical protein